MASTRYFLDALKRFNHEFDAFNVVLAKEGNWPKSLLLKAEDLSLQIYKFRMNAGVILNASEDRLKEKLIA